MYGTTRTSILYDGCVRCCSKGDYSGAIGEYVKTVGHLEPSFVIRKYLDAQRIPQLCTYLKELHLKLLPPPAAYAYVSGVAAGPGARGGGLAIARPLDGGRAQQVLQPEHTMLLLNCYAKLRDNAALELFIKVSLAHTSSVLLLMDQRFCE